MSQASRRSDRDICSMLNFKARVRFRQPGVPTIAWGESVLCVEVSEDHHASGQVETFALA